MFNNLVESGSHRAELTRKGRFFLGTLGLYGLLLTVSGVASVVAYDVRLERQNLDLYMMVAPPPIDAPTRPVAEPEPPAGAPERPGRGELPERVDQIARLNDSTTAPDTISTTPNRNRELPPGLFARTGRDFDPGAGGGPAGPAYTSGHVSRERTPVRVEDTDDLPPPTPAPTPKPPGILKLTSHVISGKVVSKPVPPYPAIAKATGTQGSVSVEILIDEQGRVVSAQAVSGPAMLRDAARRAALQARFTPTFLGGQPVKVSGVITYNFMLN